MKTRYEGESVSVWQDVQIPYFSALASDIQVDVCVIGAGVAGLTTAYLLMKEGKSVAIIEDSEIASGQSNKTTAQLTYALDERYFNLEKYHGEEGARLAAESHRQAMRRIEKIVREEHIRCELEHIDGYLFSLGDKRPNILEKEFEAIQRVGLTDVSRTQKSPSNKFDIGPSLIFRNQIQIHPLKYLSALAEIISDSGVKIFTHTRAVEVKGGKKAYVKTQDGFKINCESIVVATHSPINDIFAIHTKQAAYRTYVMAFKIQKASVPLGLYWDTLDPYHYVRIEKKDDYDILIVGGEDHKTGQESIPDKCYKSLELWTRSLFFMAEEVLYKWSGQVLEPVDGLAYLGRNPLDHHNVFVITGDSGNGVTHSTIGAMLITDLIMSRPNPWEKLYKPNRVSLKSSSEFIKENSNVAAQYFEWIQPKPEPDLQELENDQGVVFRDGMELIGVYKDSMGHHEYISPVCPHLGGVVRWNSAEKSWDCPCHGSRFDCHGKVIEGPATSDLKKLDVKDPIKVANEPNASNTIEMITKTFDFQAN